MPQVSSSRRGAQKRRYVIVLFAVLLVVVAIFLLQKVVLTRVAQSILPLVATSAHVDLKWDHLHAGLFIPMTLEDVQIQGAEKGDETSVRINKVVLEFSNLWEWWKGRQRLFKKVRVEGINGVLDFRWPSEAPLVAFFRNRPRYQVMMFPWSLEVQAPDCNLLFDGLTYRLRNFSANVSEDFLGTIRYSFAKIETPAFEKAFPASSALATWKSGTLSIVQWTLLPDCTMDLMNIHFLGAEGLSVDFAMSAFGGTVKGSLVTKGYEKRSDWDAALVAQQVELEKLAKALEIQAPVLGILKEGKLTFRGHPGKLADAEASVRVSAEDVFWNHLGWQTLEFGADLINHRIAVPEFRLRQEENFLSLNGSATIPKSIRDFSKTPFEISVVGNIQNLEALARLLGPKFQQLHGRMTLDGSLWSGKDGPNGYLKLEASSICFQEAQFTSARMNMIFRSGNVGVTSCELWNGEDFLSAHGNVDLNAPSYQYSGGISIRMRDIASYRSLLEENWQRSLHSGGIQLTWQGDGTLHRHSGAFTLRMDRLVSRWTPGGVTGNATGTFSPGYLSFDDLELLQGPLRLAGQVSLSPLGVKVNDLKVSKAAAPLAEGSAFLPMNVFAVAGGASWKEAFLPEKPLFLDMNLKKLDLADLCRLIGQNVSLSGAVQSHVLMTGNSQSWSLQGQLTGNGVGGKWNQFELPPSKVRMNVSTAQGRLAMSASVQSRKMGGIQGAVSLPINSEKASFTRFLNFSGPFGGNLSAENLDLSVFKFLLPGLTQMEGYASGELSFNNTLSQPRAEGHITLTRGSFGLIAGMPPFSSVQLTAAVRNNQVSLEACQGKLGQGVFSLQGGMNFSQLNEPRYDLAFVGDRLLLYWDPDLMLQANVHLLAQGDSRSGKISGTIRFQNSELRRRIEVVPNLSSDVTSKENSFFWEKSIPAPFNLWNMDVSISNDSSFLVKSNLTQAKIISDLHLGGTLGNVLPSGSIEFKNLRAVFPFAVAEIPTGRIFFDPKYPRKPLLDAQGFVDLAGYTLQVSAMGLLSHPSLFFDSDPPISQQCISLLLLTGESPCRKDLQLASPLDHVVFPLQMLRTLSKDIPISWSKSKYEIRIPESFSLIWGWTLHEFPGTASDYHFRLVR